MKGLYPGTFDPITNGHLDIIKRAALLVDELHIVVAINNQKKSLFSPFERLEMIKLVTKTIKNIKISFHTGLTVRYALENNIKVIFRGLRNFNDFENEYLLYNVNKELSGDIETLLLMPSSRNQIISSSIIKDLINNNADISKYVPIEIVDLIKNKIKSLN